MSENMRIAYTSENKIYLLENGNKTEIPCGRIIKYKEALDSIRRRTEWKTTGSGAQFMGMAENGAPDEENITARISGLSFDGERLIYAVRLDGSAALYQRSTDRKDMNEGLILSGNSFTFGAVDSLEGKLAVSMGSSVNDLHIAVMEPPSSDYTELTDGDTVEEDPWLSRYEKGRIYFSTAGNARNEYGAVGAVSPRSGAYIDPEGGELCEFLSDPKTDYLKIKDDKFGNIYYIRRPYEEQTEGGGVTVGDVLLFPVRILKALFGWLSFMSTIWGGEPLKKGDTGLPGGVKGRNRSQRDIIIDGNIIKAEQLAKEAQLKDDDPAGLMPLSRELVKREADGRETVLKKGVLDYTVCGDGRLIISNGRHITLLDGDKETHLARAQLAMNITEVSGE